MNTKITVAFVFGGLGGGGAQRQFSWLIQNIDRQRFNPVVISISSKKEFYDAHITTYPDETSLDAKGKKDEFSKFKLYRSLKDDFEIHFIERKGYRFIAKKLLSIYKEITPDVIVFITPMAAVYGGVMSRYYNKAKVIHGVRGNGILLSYSKTLFNVYHLFSQIFIDYFVVNSNGLKQNMIKTLYQKNKVKVIYNGIPIFFDRDKIIQNEVVKIAYIGRFEKVKNHEMFLKAISLLKSNTSFEVHLYGAGSLENTLKQQVEELQLEDKVFFKGWVTDVSRVLEQIDVVCLTSDFEGFNNSISEAQMHGIPVVSTNCTGSSEIVKDAITGFVVPVKAHVEFAKKLDVLIEDDVLREQMAIAAYKRSRAQFTIKQMCKNYELLFETIIK